MLSTSDDICMPIIDAKLTSSLIVLLSPHMQVQPIIDIPGYGDRAAELMCQKLKITSQNDTKKLAEAKAEVYLKGFTHGTLIVGPHKGQAVRYEHVWYEQLSANSVALSGPSSIAVPSCKGGIAFQCSASLALNGALNS